MSIAVLLHLLKACFNETGFFHVIDSLQLASSFRFSFFILHLQRVDFSFYVPYPAVFKQRLLCWLDQFSCVAFLDSNNWKQDVYSSHDCIAGCSNDLVELNDDPFVTVDALRKNGKHLFGYFGYDLKNKIEKLHSDNPNHTGFPDACFFAADVLIELKNHEVRITTDDNAHKIFESISNVHTDYDQDSTNPIKIEHRTPKKKYVETVNALRDHIENGDFYEINYCQEFFCTHANVEPLSLFEKLNKKSAAPFAAYFKFNELCLLSSSPERFLKRLGGTLISQPIKGTAPRDLTNVTLDERFKSNLRNSEKEKAENVMIVDLVRNDLNRVCKTASVNVEELFGVYSFPTVHHLISTVTGTQRPDATFEQIMKAAFPMGSMTGAPKVEAMKAIEFYEDVARGAYSGCAGYVNPNGDFDFNVIIRTVLWNATTNYLSFHTGGAITFDSNAQAEYDECILKAKAITDILSN